MPGGKKPIAGGSKKDQKQYESIKDDLQSSGRYGSRAKEVAARIVNKRRAEEGRTKKDSK